MRELGPARRCLAILLCLFGAGTGVAAENPSPFQVEAFVAAEAALGVDDLKDVDDDSWLSADLIASYTRDRFHVFGEYYATPSEHVLDRFEAGFEPAVDTTVWLGRFQQPASAWNTEQHRGRYLQTAVTRPSIENWEDEQGILPQHITGAAVDSRHSVGADGSIDISAGVGAAPNLNGDQLQPIDVAGPNPGRHGLGSMARVAFLPEATGTNTVGLLAARDVVYASGPATAALLHAAGATLTVVGGFSDWTGEPWHASIALYQIDVALMQTSRRENFTSGYLQVERQLPARLTAYGRLEDSARMQASTYVAVFDEHSRDLDVALRRGLTGLRWDYAHHQALNAELSRIVSFEGHAVEFRLQWTAALP
jgi:hypothetical protein